MLGVAALDELLAGLPVLGAPDIQAGLTLSYSAVAALVLVLPAVAGMILEPPLLILADRYPRKWFVCGGLIVMGLAIVMAGLAPSPWILGTALIAWYVGSGCSVGLAQATLMDLEPADRERCMARWGLLSTLGDLAAPLVLAIVAWASLDWRWAFGFSGVLVVFYGVFLAGRAFPRRVPVFTSGSRSLSLLAAVRAALRNKRLLLWLSACWLCELLDELFVVFAALHLRDAMGLGPAARAIVIALFSLGLVVGLVIAERLLARAEPLRLLRTSASACGVCYLGWLACTQPVVNAALLFAVGAFSAPLYPIAKAQAYRVLPAESGMVNAVGNLFMPASIALPLMLGVIAERAGLVIALMVLVVQPVGLCLIAHRILINEAEGSSSG